MNNEQISIKRLLDDISDQDEVRKLLAHKPLKYQQHLNKLFEGKCTVKTEFYLAYINRELVGVAMVSFLNGVGYVSHVFTKPEQRGKGVSTQLIKEVIDQFENDIVVLGCEYGSAAYRIYKKLNFEEFGAGRMYRKFNEIEIVDSMFEEDNYLL